MSQKTVKIVLGITLSNLTTNFDNFRHRDGRGNIIMYGRCTHLPPHLIYVNALPCETQMLQIVTLRGDHLYQIAVVSKCARGPTAGGSLIPYSAIA